jgi:hypothetical protein
VEGFAKENKTNMAAEIKESGYPFFLVLISLVLSLYSRQRRTGSSRHLSRYRCSCICTRTFVCNAPAGILTPEGVSYYCASHKFLLEAC